MLNNHDEIVEKLAIIYAATCIFERDYDWERVFNQKNTSDIYSILLEICRQNEDLRQKLHKDDNFTEFPGIQPTISTDQINRFYSAYKAYKESRITVLPKHDTVVVLSGGSTIDVPSVLTRTRCIKLLELVSQKGFISDIPIILSGDCSIFKNRSQEQIPEAILMRNYIVSLAKQLGINLPLNIITETLSGDTSTNAVFTKSITLLKNYDPHDIIIITNEEHKHRSSLVFFHYWREEDRPEQTFSFITVSSEGRINEKEEQVQIAHLERQVLSGVNFPDIPWRTVRKAIIEGRSEGLKEAEIIFQTLILFPELSIAARLKPQTENSIQKPYKGESYR